MVNTTIQTTTDQLTGVPNRYSYPATVTIQTANDTNEFHHFSDLQMAYIWIINFINDIREIDNLIEIREQSLTEWTDNGEPIKTFPEIADRLDNNYHANRTTNWTCVASNGYIMIVLYYGLVTNIQSEYINGVYSETVTYLQQ